MIKIYDIIFIKMRCVKKSNNNQKCMIKSLTDEEFDNLIKYVQLLKSYQIQQIIQKFSFPIAKDASNNTNLLLIIMQSPRHDIILTSIYNEIKRLFFRKDISMFNKLQIVQYDDNFESPKSFLYRQTTNPLIFGPIFVSPGNSSGEFQFIYSKPKEKFESQINISFLFKKGIPHQFELEAEFNGFQIDVSIEDPYPQPIDISDLINLNSETNTLNIKKINSCEPMMICIREYSFYDIESMMEEIAGKPIKIGEEDLYVISRNCFHNNAFSLTNFLSTSYATGECKCPICGGRIDPFKLCFINNS